MRLPSRESFVEGGCIVQENRKSDGCRKTAQKRYSLTLCRRRLPTRRAGTRSSCLVVHTGREEMIVLPHGRCSHLGRFDAVVCHQVKDRPTSIEEIIRDDPAVAAPPDSFGAHDHAWLPLDQINKPAEPRVEIGGY